MAPERRRPRLDAGSPARADPRPERERRCAGVPADPDRGDRGVCPGGGRRGRALRARPLGLRRAVHHGGRDVRRRDPPQQPVAADLDLARQRGPSRGPRPPSPGRRPAVAAASMWAAWAVEPHEATDVVGGLRRPGSPAPRAGVRGAARHRRRAHRTRQELARVAVAEERERSLATCTTSWATPVGDGGQGPGRTPLAATDPDAVVGHAADIEQIGRRARRRTPGCGRDARTLLADELDEVRRALDAAGIATTVHWSATEPSGGRGAGLGAPRGCDQRCGTPEPRPAGSSSSRATAGWRSPSPTTA